MHMVYSKLFATIFIVSAKSGSKIEFEEDFFLFFSLCCPISRLNRTVILKIVPDRVGYPICIFRAIYFKSKYKQIIMSIRLKYFREVTLY